MEDTKVLDKRGKTVKGEKERERRSIMEAELDVMYFEDKTL